MNFSRHLALLTLFHIAFHRSLIQHSAVAQEEKICPPFNCGKDKDPVPKWPLKLSSSGCNAGGGISMMSMGGFMPDPALNGCCDQRNACYQICGSTKMMCDDRYKACQASVCAKSPVGSEKCNKDAEIGNLLSNLNGCGEFDAAQAAACDCVKKGEAVENARKTFVSSFYKKYNRDGLHKVDALMKKVDDTKKLVQLTMRLVAKYPKVIKKKVDRQQRYMDDMMRKMDREDAAKGKKTRVVEEDDELEDDSEEHMEL